MSSLYVFNENSSGYISVSFVNKDGDEALPSSITYRIDCVTNDEVVRGDTEVAPVDATHVFHITPSDNAILSDSNTYEKKRITIIADYGDDDQLTIEETYLVKNLSQIS